MYRQGQSEGQLRPLRFWLYHKQPWGLKQNSVFDLKGATLSSKLDSLFEASWRDGSH